jgi:hypothetical protein
MWSFAASERLFLSPVKIVKWNRICCVVVKLSVGLEAGEQKSVCIDGMCLFFSFVSDPVAHLLAVTLQYFALNQSQ